MFWWKTKILLSIALIAHSVAGNLGLVGFMPQPATTLALLLVVAGGGANLYHYFLLKKANNNISNPRTLVKRKGLYRLCRHPMYFCDLVWCLGIALYPMSAISILLYSALAVAVNFLAQSEDEKLAREDVDFERWRDSTRLLLPVPRSPKDRL